ncbi:Scr1 family TA system antitoxin-like transcriptional regulator [Streptomyces sp. NPDC058374]|uniref:Scr1 family TA system antitoxin-like transcriptional regulator n=1 Tax=Streptomyces sp. NPDC058374 TaxID=3346466 RepID=UPI003664CD1A
MLATDDYSATLASRGQGFGPEELAYVRSRLRDGSLDCTVVQQATTLWHRIVDARALTAQLARLVELNRYENVSIGVIPEDTAFAFVPPETDFTMIDDKRVLVPLLSDVWHFTTNSELALYRREMAACVEAAAFDGSAVQEIAGAIAEAAKHYSS